MQTSRILSIRFWGSFFGYPVFVQQNTNLNGLAVDHNGNLVLGVLIKISSVFKTGTEKESVNVEGGVATSISKLDMLM